MLVMALENLTGDYTNKVLTRVNDHVIRVSVMTKEFYWHYHPNSDETFQVLEGGIRIDLEDETIELQPGQLFTVPKNAVHRTRPVGDRSVNITFERQDMETIKVRQPERSII
ncbi:cupin domain-containing protein [Pedobacter sp. HMF7056]|uniref:Cupin domain-containing protein n=2 Tax=Hufsiella ginkgonis TaxID=2695274 RepID=A0A7K1Y0H3_9SPHI|nr:cupin domain-containing protein [Hufsiella ginkgonis]